MPFVDFTHPLALWLLLLLVPVALLWRRNDLGAARGRIALALRALIVILLVLALAGVRWLLPSDRLCVIFAVDASLSMSGAQQDQARAFVNRAVGHARPGDPVGVILFGRDAWFERAPAPLAPGEQLPAFTTEVERGHTDIARALLLAESAFPEGCRKRVVLLSDGNETLGDAAREAGLGGERDVRVWTWTPPVATAVRDARVDRVETPENARQDEPFDVRVQVHSSVEAAAGLVARRNGRSLGRLPVALHAGDNVFFVPQRLDRAGAFTYDVSVDLEGDANPRNDAASGITFVQGRPRVLYVTGTGEPPGALPAMLAAQGVEVETVSARGLPVTLGALEHYAGVVLANVAATELSEAQLRMTAAYARDLGGGLVMLGGPDAFGAGGWQGTPVADVLPVLLDVRKRKYLPTVAMVLAIDKSGSMAEMAGGVEKMAVAREGAIATLNLLGNLDRIGVVAFDEAARWVVPMRTASRRDEIVADVATLRAGGGTDMYPALQEALRALRGVKAVVKHVIVLSDGITAPRDFRGLVARLQQAGITVSCVGIGPDADHRFMTELARQGRGRAWFTDDGAVVPRIFMRDAMTASRSAIAEEPFVPRVASTHAILRGVKAPIPPLLGYVMTSPRATARTPLETPQGDPLLAAWRIGLGKSMAFTSDDGRRWGRPWARWNQAASLLVQAVRWTFPDGSPSALRVTAETRGSTVTLGVDAGDRNFMDLRATVLDAEANAREVTVQQTGPGRYAGSFEVDGPGSYLVSVRDARTGEMRKVPVVFPYSPEYACDGPDRALLESVATASGGRAEVSADDVFERTGAQARVAQDGRELLAFIAILLLPLDFALRRVFLPPGWAAALRAKLGARPLAAAPEAATLSALKVRKASVRAEAEAQTAAAPKAAAAAPKAAAPTESTPSVAPSTESTLEQLKKARRERRG